MNANMDSASCRAFETDAAGGPSAPDSGRKWRSHCSVTRSASLDQTVLRHRPEQLLCAEATDADAVPLSEPSATRMLPDWPRSKLVDPAVQLRTWAAWQTSPAPW
jgi:hypothetical protein